MAGILKITEIGVIMTIAMGNPIMIRIGMMRKMRFLWNIESGDFNSMFFQSLESFLMIPDLV